MLYPLVASLLVANTINIAADLAAMGEALRLVAGGSAVAFAVLFGIACLIAEVFIPYHRYAGYLKLLTLVLLFYVAAAFSVHIPWGEVAAGDACPEHPVSIAIVLLMVVAVFGTTISPYLFFWQASQEAEESRLSHRHMSCTGSAAEEEDRIHSRPSRSTPGPACSFPISSPSSSS